MTFDLVAIDLGKSSFHLHGVSCDGVVLSRKVTRARLLAVISELSPAVVAMEACPGTHHWGRIFQEVFQEEGWRVLLIHPRLVKPFVRGAKNDAVAIIVEGPVLDPERPSGLRLGSAKSGQNNGLFRSRVLLGARP